MCRASIPAHSVRAVAEPYSLSSWREKHNQRITPPNTVPKRAARMFWNYI